MEEKMGVGAWLRNFWYHYKVPTVIVAVLLVVGIVCTVQLCAKGPKADIHVCYAGEFAFIAGEENSGANIVKTLQSFAPKNQAGEDLTVDFYHYQIFGGDFVPSPQQNQNNKQALKDELDLGNAYLFLLSDGLFETYTQTATGGRYVRPVADYLPKGSTAELTEDGFGVYLHSIPLGEMPGFCDLPEDTVLCLRVQFAIGNRGENYAACEELFRKMLSE